MIKRIAAAYFSPTGGTRKVAREFLKAAKALQSSFGIESIEERDFTLPENRKTTSYGSSDLVFVFMPVYFGRIPSPFHGFLPFEFNGALVVPVAVFGNRDYDDALRELADECSRIGGLIPAGAAFVARHSQHPLLGAGRPDASDSRSAFEFVEMLLAKTSSIDPDSVECPIPGFGLGGYKPYGVVPAAPVVARPEHCRICARCAQRCPVGIIDSQNFTAASSACIGCRACMAWCPEEARDFPEPVASMISAKMQQIYEANAAPKPNSYWL